MKTTNSDKKHLKKAYQTIEDYVKNKAGVTKQEVIVFVNQNYDLKINT